MSQALFRENAYLKTSPATVMAINERGGIILDRSIFYATGGGQPGDSGILTLADGKALKIATTVYGGEAREIILVPASGDNLPKIGDTVEMVLDWNKRHKHMRVHTALHLMCATVPFPVTGGQISEDGGRLDFKIDNPEAVDKDDLTTAINELITANHPVSQSAMSAEELAAKPDLIRTMSVKPPVDSGQVRLIAIGEQGRVDLQPCGGTHVQATGEIGPIAVTKIENKGKENRRIRLRLL